MRIQRHWTIPIVLLVLATALLAVAGGSDQPAQSETGNDVAAVSDTASEHADEAEVAAEHEGEGHGEEAEIAAAAPAHDDEAEEGHGGTAAESETGHGHESDIAAAVPAEGEVEEGHGHAAEEESAHGHGSKTTVIEGAPEIVLEATEWGFAPETLRLTKGEPVTIVLANEGVIEHEVELPGLHLHAQAGETVKGSFIPGSSGQFEFACELPAHREAGMVGTLIVEPAVQHDDGDGHDHEGAA